MHWDLHAAYNPALHNICICVTLVVKTTVLMADMKDFSDINEIYKQCKWMFCFHFSSILYSFIAH